jgi:hypothetical protein
MMTTRPAGEGFAGRIGWAADRTLDEVLVPRGQVFVSDTEPAWSWSDVVDRSVGDQVIVNDWKIEVRMMERHSTIEVTLAPAVSAHQPSTLSSEPTTQEL